MEFSSMSINKIMEYVNINMTENDILQKCDPDNYKNFTGTIMLIFDLDPEIVYHLTNRDLLWRPSKRNGNYIQWLSQETDEREPIEEVLSYLFRKSDPQWSEPYDFDLQELDLRKKHIEKIENKYNGLDNYLKTISERLWKDSDYLKNEYSHVLNYNK